MLIKCPKCGQECEVITDYDATEFNFTCPNCQKEIVVVKNNQLNSENSTNKDTSSIIDYSNQRKDNMKYYKIMFFLAAMVFVLVLTCPNKNDHKEALKSRLSTFVNENSSSNDEIFGVNLGSLVFSGIAELVLENKLTVKNYYLFSIGEINIDGNKKVVSFGILKYVFTPNANQLNLHDSYDDKEGDTYGDDRNVIEEEDPSFEEESPSIDEWENISDNPNSDDDIYSSSDEEE